MESRTRTIETPAGPILESGPPGMGADHSTRLLLESMRVRAGDLVAEPGCGAGIIGICAALSGADRVVGVDMDPACIEAARANARLNRVHNIEFRLGSLLQPVDEAPDLVVANLPQKPGAEPLDLRSWGGESGAELLLSLIEQSGRKLGPGGRLLILVHRLTDYRAVLERFSEDFSVTLAGERKRYFTREEFKSRWPGFGERLARLEAEGLAETRRDARGEFFLAGAYLGVRL